MSNEALKKSLAQLESITTRNLTLEQTEALLTRTRTAMSDLSKRIDREHQTLAKDFNNADPFAIGQARRLILRFQSQADYLTNLEDSLETHFHQKQIETRMAERLGGPKSLRALEYGILFLIVSLLGLLIYDMTAGPDITRPFWLTSKSIFFIDAFCCVIFMSEFLLRLSCAESKRFVWKHHWVDFATSIPIPGEAQLSRFGRLGRLARFARILRLLRFARLFFFLWRGMDKLQDVMDVKMMKKTIRWSVMATLAGAFFIYQLEGNGSAGDLAANPVSTFGKAIWWSFTTVLTGGFGDIHNPSSTSGQVLTGLLVVVGMVLVGVFTATLTTIFVGQQSETENENIDSILTRLDEFTTQNNRLADRDTDETN
ncbi:ion transporter [Rhodopirellula sp.]|nr:ion transporter [Rubripirellula sp.]MDA7874739.1 ion transporter [Rhodopirellula sp.]MDB4624732.1 ion transporter [Rubripirellula sp.]